MKRFAVCLSMLLLMFFGVSASAAVTLKFTVPGTFTSRTAVILAQQVFNNLSPDIVSKLDPTSGARPYYYELTSSNLIIYFRVNT